MVIDFSNDDEAKRWSPINDSVMGGVSNSRIVADGGAYCSVTPWVTWRSTVLGAVGEVETALAAYQANHRAVAAARRSVGLYEQSVRLTRELIVNQGATVQDLLDAERQLATTRVGLARAERDLARSFVTLNVALGSGSGTG